MKKYLKAGMLTLLLVIPAFIILFLHGFSENHFELPYLMPRVDAQGNVMIQQKDTVFYQVPKSNNSVIEVVSFYADSATNVAQQFQRLQKFDSDQIEIRHIKGDTVERVAINVYQAQPFQRTKPAKTVYYSEQFMLIDREGYIRGRYDATDPIEVDRLMAEIKILQDIYEKQ